MDFVFGLASALCFGLADFNVRFSTRRVGIFRTLFYMQLIGLLAVTLYLLATGALAHLEKYTQFQPWLWGILTAILNTISYLCLYRAFAIGKLAVVAPIASGYAAVSVLLSFLGGETLTLLQILGVVAVLIGVVLAALHKEEHTSEANTGPRKSILPAGVPWAILAALGLGTTFWLLGAKVTPALGESLPVWLFRLVALVILAPAALIMRLPLGLTAKRVNIPLLASIGLLDTGAFIFSTLGFATGAVAIVSVLSSLYSAVAVILAWIVLREKLRLLQWFGIAIILTGIVMTHL